MKTLIIVQQPASCNVVQIEAPGFTPQTRGEAKILYQHTRERCEGYILGRVDETEDVVLWLESVRCLTGDCRNLTWYAEGKNPSVTFDPRVPQLWLGLEGESAR
jgi:hypothetical protein